MNLLFIFFLNLQPQDVNFKKVELDDFKSFSQNSINQYTAITLKPTYTITSKKDLNALGEYQGKTIIFFDKISAGLKSSTDFKGNKKAQMGITTKFLNDHYHLKTKFEMKENQKGEKVGSAQIEARYTFGD
jgi:hypothetical protein